jgi:hypothetical protein
MCKRWLLPCHWALPLAALIWGTALVGAADDTSIKVPVKARVLFANGRTYTGTVLAISDKEVEFEIARAGAKPMKYKAGAIKAIQTADALYIWNVDKAMFEAAAAPTAKPPAVGPAKAPPAPAPRLPPNNQLRFLVVPGMGKDAEAAAATARREAVRQVVVSLVGSATYAREEKALAEQVLARADDWIKGKQEVERREEKDSWHVRLLAAVDIKALTARLKEAGLKVREGPRGTGTDVPSEAEIKAHPAEAVAEVLADLPLALVGAVVSTDPEEGNALRVHVQFSMDVEAYDHVILRLRKVLEVIRVGKEELTVPVRAKGPNRYMSEAKAINAKTTPGGKVPVWQLWVETGTTGLAQKTQWELNYLDVDARTSMAPVDGRLYALLTALGPDGQLAGMDLNPLEPGRAQWDNQFWYKWVSAHVPPTKDRPSQFFVSPVGLQPTQLKVNQAVDYQVETGLDRTLRVRGIMPEQVSAVYCTLLYLPD